MRFYADLHIHSHYSRATSKDLNLEHLWLWAQLKGIQVVGTGDCLHPGWMKELEEKLIPAEDGLFRLRDEYTADLKKNLPAKCRADIRFMLTVEVSNIYKRLEKVRKIHNVLFFPSFEAAKSVQKKLEAIGNIRADGRPILGLDSHDLLEMVLESDPSSYLIPAHIWTPWFSILGSKSGFDRIEDCFADLTPYVFALETGLSSDPPMNWRLGQLDNFVLVSNSDAHSPGKLGREATIFTTEFSYVAIFDALKKKEPTLEGTIEFFPEEGKYHYDGHRQCQVRMNPKETISHQGVCPVCGKNVTVGVMSRVEELADYPDGRRSPNARPYYRLIPLPEIIAEAKGMGVGSKAVQETFMGMLYHLGSEIFILREADLNDIKKIGGELIAEGVRRVREEEVTIAAGYDGEYGRIAIFTDEERSNQKSQLTLF